MPDRWRAAIDYLPLLALWRADPHVRRDARRRDLDRLLVAALTAIVTYYTTASPPPAPSACAPNPPRPAAAKQN